MTGGNGADGSVTGVHEGSREGAHYTQDCEGSWVAAARDLMVTGGTPATCYGDGAVRVYVVTANQRGKSEGKMSGRTVSSP